MAAYGVDGIYFEDSVSINRGVSLCNIAGIRAYNDGFGVLRRNLEVIRP